MDFFSKVFALFGINNPNYYTTQQIGTVVPEWVNTSDKWNLYYSIPELNAVINRFADMVASANPMIVDKEGNPVKNNGNPIFKLIDRPNAMQSWGKMMKFVAINQCITNNVIVYAPNGSFGKLQLMPLAFNNVKIVPTGQNLITVDLKSFIKEFQIPISRIDTYTTFLPEEIIYITEVDGIDMFNSRSKIDALKMPLSNLQKQYEKRNVLLRNMFSLGILSSGNKDDISSLPLEDEDIKKIRKDMKARNEGEVIITDKPIKFEPMTFPVKDLMLFEEMTADKLAIIDAYGLNQHMFGQGEGGKGSTFSNVEMGERQAYNSTIIPTTEILYDEFTKQMKLHEEGMYLVPDFSHISVLKEDQTRSAEAMFKRASAVEKISNITPLSDEEKRNLLGI